MGWDLDPGGVDQQKARWCTFCRKAAIGWKHCPWLSTGHGPYRMVEFKNQAVAIAMFCLDDLDALNVLIDGEDGGHSNH